MKDAIYIKTRLNNVNSEIVPQSIEYTAVHNARQETLMWIYNYGSIRTEKEIQNRLERVKEELIAFDFANQTGLPLKIANAKKQEIENILE